MRPSMIARLKTKQPALVCMLDDVRYPDECIAIMRNAVYDGADAFYIHLDHLDPGCWNPADLRKIFDYAGDKPVIALFYRRKSCPCIPMMSSSRCCYGPWRRARRCATSWAIYLTRLPGSFR